MSEIISKISADMAVRMNELAGQIENLSTTVGSRLCEVEKTLGATAFAAEVFSSPLGRDPQTPLQTSGPGLGGSSSMPASHDVPGSPLATFVQNLRTQQKLLSPQPYEGKEAWEVYIRQFEVIANRNNWSPREKCDVLASILRGEALLILSSFPPGHTIQYSELCRALEQRFGLDPATSMSQFRLRTQKPKETLQDYSLNLQRLAHSAFSDCPLSATERLMVAQFIDGLRNPNLQIMVQLRNPATIRDATKTAIEIEARLNRSQGHRLCLVDNDADQPLPGTSGSMLGASGSNRPTNFRRRNRGGYGNRNNPLPTRSQPVQSVQVQPSENINPSEEGGTH